MRKREDRETGNMGTDYDEGNVLSSPADTENDAADDLGGADSNRMRISYNRKNIHGGVDQ